MRTRLNTTKIEGSESYVSSVEFDGREIVKVAPEALTVLANTAMRDVSFLLRTEHNEQVASILADPDASSNDRGVAMAFLRNAEISASFELPLCQDTGTATVIGKKGEQIWTGANDAEKISAGVFRTYTEENLRYSQTVALDMYREKNTGTNLPAQIDLYAHRRRCLQVPVYRQRRRLGQQVHALPGNQGTAQPGDA